VEYIVGTERRKPTTHTADKRIKIIISPCFLPCSSGGTGTGTTSTGASERERGAAGGGFRRTEQADPARERERGRRFPTDGAGRSGQRERERAAVSDGRRRITPVKDRGRTPEADLGRGLYGENS
jgi:hypothetical protein